MIQGGDKIQRQIDMGLSVDKYWDWKPARWLFQFHLSLEVDEVNMDITSRQITDILNIISSRDPEYYEERTKSITSAAKKEHELKVRDNCTLIGSTLKT